MSANTTSLKWDNPSVESLFRLLRIALGNGGSSCTASKVDWQEVYDLSMQQRVGAIACDGLFALEQCDIDEDLRYKWLGQSMVIEQKATAQWKQACQLASLYAQHGIKTYLFISPIFPYITDIQSICDRVSPHVDMICFENLNLRGSAKQDILNYIAEKYPQYLKEYQNIYTKGDISYWEQLESHIKEMSAGYKVPFVSYFYHDKIRKGGKKS